MDIGAAANPSAWDTFLSKQRFRPFMQSWTMGEVYREVGEEPIRLEVRDGDATVGICQALVVNAKRGKHLSVPYGPVVAADQLSQVTGHLIESLKEEAAKRGCSFIRLSPFWTEGHDPIPESLPAPMHLLAEHIWYIPLTEPDLWSSPPPAGEGSGMGVKRSEEEILMEMRKTTRNLIRRSEREGVTIERSADPVGELDAFIRLHDETRKRHGFVPYTDDFFRAQVKHFAPRGECSLYKAVYNGEVIAASIHMHAFGETSYHHGASTHKFEKIPASYLLQWTAIRDALRRGDRIYSFWGVSPEGVTKHPFAGVRTFKTGFGGKLLPLTHCMDVPVTGKYRLTRAFETLRKWRRGF